MTTKYIKARTDNAGAIQEGTEIQTRAASDGGAGLVQAVYQDGASIVDTTNSSTAALGANATYTGAWIDLTNYINISVAVSVSAASATNGLIIQWSMDGVTIDDTDTFTILANKQKQFTFGVAHRYLRVVYTNGATPTTVRLQTMLHTSAPKPSSHRLQDAIVDEDDVELNKSVISGKTAQGTYVNFGSTNGGNFKVSIEEIETNVVLPVTQVDADGNSIVVTGANTGAKGIRVYGGPTDPISDIPVHIDYDHHQNHEGEAHQYTYPLTALASGATVYFRLVVPVYNPVIYSPHMRIELDALAQATAVLYEAPTTSTTGTLQTSYNRNRNQSAVAAGMLIYLAPTVTNTGTALSSHTVGDAAAGTSANLNFDEWILSSNKVYLIGITANAAQCSVCLRIKWYEDLGV